MDIHMPDIDGLNAGKYIRNINNDVVIIFVTAIKDYMAEAFGIRASDYLLKPFDEVRFKEKFLQSVEYVQQKKLFGKLKEKTIR